jgi:hypothetical protein
MVYRLDLPTMTLAFKDNHHAATTLPAGSVVEVTRPDVDDRFLVVKASQEELLVFATDLKDRATPIRPSRSDAFERTFDAVGDHSDSGEPF